MPKNTRKYGMCKKRNTRKMKGGAKQNDWSDCNHIRSEYHTYPSLLIKIKRPTDKKPIGPNRAYKFYDCKVIDKDKKGNPITYAGRSCDNPKYDGIKIHKKEIKKTGYASDIEELINWCCPENRNNNNNSNTNNTSNNNNNN